MEEKYSSEYVRFIPQGQAGSPNKLHRIVFQTLVFVIVVITSKEQSIIAHLCVGEERKRREGGKENRVAILYIDPCAGICH